MVEYLIETEKVTSGWIGVHGESIGGVVACHLAATCDDVSLLIADRNFRCLPAVAETLIASWASKALRKVLGWEADNVNNALAACNRAVSTICLCDPADEIIANKSSLKVGIARKVSTECTHRDV